MQDSHYLHKIIQSIPTLPIQCVEIGVGLGDLTQELLKIESLIAYEVDLDLCSLLDKKFSSHIQSGRLKIIYENVLNFPQEQQWLYENEYKVVSNLPYYIATHIILRLLRGAIKAHFKKDSKSYKEKPLNGLAQCFRIRGYITQCTSTRSRDKKFSPHFTNS